MRLKYIGRFAASLRWDGRPTRDRTRQLTGKTHCGADVEPSVFAPPEASRRRQFRSQPLKENVMNEAPQLELVDLGDAKEVTQGNPTGPRLEDDQVSLFRQI